MEAWNGGEDMFVLRLVDRGFSGLAWERVEAN